MTGSMKELADRAAARIDKKISDILEKGNDAEVASLMIRTNRAENELGLGEILSIPYDGWSKDLASFPRRKMVLWATAFSELLSERLTRPYYAEHLLTYRWLGSAIGCHFRPVLERVENAADSSIGEFHHPVLIRNGVLLFGQDGLIAKTRNPPEELSLPYAKIHSAKLAYDDSLVVAVDGRLYRFELAVQYEDDLDRQRNFNWSFLVEHISPLEIDSMFADKHGVPDDVVAKQKELADPIAVIGEYAREGKYQAASQLGLRALEKYPDDVELVDCTLTPLARSEGTEPAIALFETIRHKIVGTDSIYAGTIMGNVIGCYDQEGLPHIAMELIRDAWIDEPVALGRLFFHNAACIACQMRDFDLARKALNWAAHFGESESDLEDEGDFVMLRKQPGYDELLAKVKSGELTVVSGTKFGPGDGPVLVASFARKPDLRVLYYLVQTRSLAARELFEQLLRSPHTGEELMSSAFYCLIGLGDDDSLALARELLPIIEKRSPGYDFFLDIGDVKSMVPDKETLVANIKTICGDNVAEAWV